MMTPRELWLGAGWLALAAAGTALLIVPALRHRALLHGEIASHKVELAKPTDGPEVIDRLTSDLSRLREFGKGRMTPIPPESDVAGLMKIFGDTLSQLGLDKRDITTRTPKSFGDTASLPVTVALSGPFPRIYSAISRIESMPRLVRVERLRLTREEPRDKKDLKPEGPVRAELSIDAFYSTPAQAAAEEGREP